MTTLSRWYVHVVGPYDTTFVGPFLAAHRANEYLRTINREVFSAYVLTEPQFRENIEQFGVAELQPPEGMVQ